MKKSYWLALTALVLLSALVAAGVPAGSFDAQAANRAADGLPEGMFVARVYYDKVEDIRLLAGFDVYEYNNKQEKYVLAELDSAGYRYLEQLGFRLAVDATRTAELNRPHEALPGQLAGIPGYPCYRTVEETFATAQNIVTAYPNLATWIDVGDSWEKAEPGGLPGYDMMVLKLTNSALPGPKPRLFVTTSIHAREYTPAELATRFAEYLVSNYGVDADVTWLLDWHEIHLMLQANPDGRKHAEAGQSWRKNTNQNYCGPTSNSRGADLNRNFDFHWGCCGGSSGLQCDDTYRGPSPTSEPETQAIQGYMRAIFPDQRGDADDAPAPADATGIYLDIHSYSELVLWPWGFTSSAAPNGAQLQTLGRKMAYFNGYEPDQSVGLYPTDGTTDDFAYGDLGVAAYTFELGTSFFQSCSTFENTILPDNLESLLYAAKVVRTPYITPAGPDALNVAVSASSVTVGDTVELSATIDDTRFDNQNGAEPTQNIMAAEVYIDVPPWDTANGPAPLAMSASDGSFDSKVEAVTTVVDTSGLVPGRHILYVRGQDAAGVWGAISAVFLTVNAPAAPDFVMSVSPAGQAICAPDDADYDVDLRGFLGYADPVTLSAHGVPTGTTTAFSTNPVTPTGSSLLTIGSTGAAAAGSYVIDVVGTAPTRTHTTTVQLDLFAAAPAAVTLSAPANGAGGVSTTPTLSWNALPDATSYFVEIASDAGFLNVVVSDTVAVTSYTPPSPLNTSSVYFWQVQASNVCGIGSTSAVWRFTTVAAPGDCGPGLAPNVLLSEGFERSAPGWTHSGSGDTWQRSTTRTHSGSAAFQATDVSAVSDQRLVSPAVLLPAGQTPLSLQFWNYQAMEDRSAGGCYDGAILEISTDGGVTWTQLEAELLTDPYDGPVSSSYGNPLAGLNAWCGDPQDWLNSVVDLDAYAGQTVQFRFRLGSDSSVGREGWTIDDVVVQGCQAPTAVTLDDLVADQAATLAPIGLPLAAIPIAAVLALVVATGTTRRRRP